LDFFTLHTNKQLYVCSVYAVMISLMTRYPEFGEPGNYTGAILTAAIESCTELVRPGGAQVGDYAMYLSMSSNVNVSRLD
jgi:hypothetical protein